MNLNHEIQNLLRTIGPGHMMTTAYDTAWIVRLGEIEAASSQLAAA